MIHIVGHTRTENAKNLFSARIARTRKRRTLLQKVSTYFGF